MQERQNDAENLNSFADISQIIHVIFLGTDIKKTFPLSARGLCQTRNILRIKVCQTRVSKMFRNERVDTRKYLR